MPVRRFRHVSEMEATLWREPGSPDLWQAIARVWDFARRTCDLRFPPGVRRHRSVEDAQRTREAWAEDNFRSYQSRRKADRGRDATARAR